jgi:hypothetical protein
MSGFQVLPTINVIKYVRGRLTLILRSRLLLEPDFGGKAHLPSIKYFCLRAQETILNQHLKVFRQEMEK